MLYDYADVICFWVMVILGGGFGFVFGLLLCIWSNKVVTIQEIAGYTVPFTIFGALLAFLIMM